MQVCQKEWSYHCRHVSETLLCVTESCIADCGQVAVTITVTPLCTALLTIIALLLTCGIGYCLELFSSRLNGVAASCSAALEAFSGCQCCKQQASLAGSKLVVD